jgi:hypothetical protein
MNRHCLVSFAGLQTAWYHEACALKQRNPPKRPNATKQDKAEAKNDTKAKQRARATQQDNAEAQKEPKAKHPRAKATKQDNAEAQKQPKKMAKQEYDSPPVESTTRKRKLQDASGLFRLKARCLFGGVL